MSIKLLVVDDSAFMRKIISDLINDIQGIEVIGIARNGIDALDIIPKINPDIITMDIEMPKLNGLETLKKIKESFDIPVIMLSSHTGRDITMEALNIGAVDFIEKPSNLSVGQSQLRSELEEKIKGVILSSKKNITQYVKRTSVKNVKDIKDIQGVAIGASTGGPKALFNIISKIPKDVKVPIFIVQHMPKGFTSSFAQRLNNGCNIPVIEAQDHMPYRKGVIYVAPGDYHMVIDKNRIYLNSNEKIHGVRPGVDYLFKAASEVYKDKLLGVLLTGMGKDGAIGMKTIKENGGYNIVQNEESCVVYGMPGSAVAQGVVDQIFGLEEISSFLNKSIKGTV